MKRCPQCQKETKTLYGGNGQTLAGCWDCWQKSHGEERWTIARSSSEQYPDAILRDEETNRRGWYEARPDMFELVVVVPISRALAAESQRDESDAETSRIEDDFLAISDALFDDGRSANDQGMKERIAELRAIERERDDLRCFANRLIDLVQETTALGCPGCAEGVPDHDCLHPKIDSVIAAITERRRETR